MTRRYIGVGLVALTAAALALSGCTSAPPPPVTPTPAEAAEVDLTPEVSDITVAALRLAGTAPVFAAEQLGFFEEYGLTVENAFVESSAAAVTQVVSGDAQVASTAYPGIVDSNLAGIPLVIVFEGLASGPGLITFEALPDSGIKSLKDLVGKRVGVPTLNSVLDGRMKVALLDAGVDPASVEFVSIPFDQVPPNLETGAIDVGVTTGASQRDVRENLNSITVLDIGDGQFDGFPESGYVMSRDFVAKNPNTVRAFQCAMEAAANELRKPGDLWIEVSTKGLGIEASALAGVPKLGFQNSVRPDRLQQVSEVMEVINLIDEPFDMASIAVPMPTNC